MKAPDLRVLTLAIRYMQVQQRGFSCHALRSAVETIHHDKTPESQRRLINRYCSQYRRSTVKVHGGREPWWWDKYTWLMSNKGEQAHRSRIWALRRFRKACIDAAKGG